MLIECLNRRAGGTLVDFPAAGDIAAAEYFFEPRSDGRHVCEVNEPAHVTRFLEITGGYREAPPTGKRKVAQQQAPVPPAPFVRLDPPDDFPRNLADMTREQLLAYAAQIQVPGKFEELKDEALRLNIQATIDLQHELHAGA